MRAYSLILIIYLLFVTCGTLNVDKVVDWVTIKKSAENMEGFSFGIHYEGADKFEIKSNLEDSINIIKGCARYALSREKDGILDVKYVVQVDSNNIGSIHIDSINSDKWVLYGTSEKGFYTIANMPSRFGLRFKGLYNIKSFKLDGFSGFHFIEEAFFDSLYIETAIGCSISACCRKQLHIKLIDDSPNFNYIFLGENNSQIPENVFLELPESFSVWLKCRSKSKGKIIINEDTLHSNNFEGSINDGIEGDKRIDLTAEKNIIIHFY